MSEYIKLFATNAARVSYEESAAYTEPYVSYVEEDESVHYNKPGMEARYLTFDILSDGTIIWNVSGRRASSGKTISYSKDNGQTWTSLVNTSASASIDVEEGDKIIFKGSNTYYCEIDDYDYYNFFGGTASFNISGNILSLFYGDNFKEYSVFPTLQSSYYSHLESMFGSSKVVDAHNLILPNHAPENCYKFTFQSCSYLIAAPDLPATTLGKKCYYEMFQTCTSLTTAPNLLAATLTQDCYRGMFGGCSSLNYVKMLAIDISANNCLTNWLFNVSATGTFVKKQGVTIPEGASGIPTGWSVQIDSDIELSS